MIKELIDGQKVRDSVLNEGFQTHLENALDSLEVSGYDITSDDDGMILKVSNFSQSDYEGLAKNLASDFKASYSEKKDGLVFGEVDELFPEGGTKY